MTRNARELDSLMTVARPDRLMLIADALKTLRADRPGPTATAEAVGGMRFRAAYRVLPDGRVQRGFA
ncbi:hypothetical protein [Nocardia terpenica]|uniref:Uncharacterized protein n=1 Tax=Nocardia terpenica TaxID=455432 RepID=A0A6G9Z720_9NOCA|nr:hypothetical protein [Nocardia terpenica]QIS21318.1 hypothetical protein F6W96_26300 [Nocardia terpenica]